MKQSNKGFTLIELLVVIAIIGILAAVVLASLNSARAKGRNAATQSELSNVRTQAELFFTEYNSYYSSGNCNVCNSGTHNLYPLLEGTASAANKTSIITANGTAGNPDSVVCHVTNSPSHQYVVAAPLATGDYWCVDSTGTSKKVTNVVAINAYACPAS